MLNERMKERRRAKVPENKKSQKQVFQEVKVKTDHCFEI